MVLILVNVIPRGKLRGITVQEANDNLAGLRGIQQPLHAGMNMLFSDEVGNNGRMAFIYDSTKVPLEGSLEWQDLHLAKRLVHVQRFCWPDRYTSSA